MFFLNFRLSPAGGGGGRKEEVELVVASFF